MTLKDYIFEHTDGFERKFVFSNIDHVIQTSQHCVKIENPFSNDKDDFLKFSNDIFSGANLPEKSKREWVQFIINMTMKVTHKLYEIDHDRENYDVKKSLDHIENIVNTLKSNPIDTKTTLTQMQQFSSMLKNIGNKKSEIDGFRVYTSKLSYEEIEKMSQEELWNLVDIAIENAVVLSSFLRDHKKELFGGDNK